MTIARKWWPLLGALWGCQPPPAASTARQASALPPAASARDAVASVEPALNAEPHSPADALPIKPWTALPLDNDPSDIQFVIVSDRTGGARAGVFEQGLATTKLLRPEFVISVGDLIEGYTSDEAEIVRQWEWLDQQVQSLGTRFYYVPGNHDFTNPVMARVWQRRLGPSYYHFTYKNALFLCLNTEEHAEARLSDAQLDYFKRVLEDHPDVRWTLLFMHRPLWAYGEGDAGRTQFARLEQYLQQRKYTVFAGHFHNYTKYERYDRRYLVLATTGGGSRLRGPLFGEFDHVVWVTLDDRGLELANLRLEGVLDENVRTEASSQELAALAQGVQVRVDNVYLAGDVYHGGVTTLHLDNHSAHPVSFTTRFGVSGALHPQPHALELELAAGERRELSVRVKVDAPVRLSPAVSVPFEWQATVAREPKPWTLEGQSDFAVARAFELRARHQPVVVDGRLEEWGRLGVDVRQPGELLGGDAWVGPEDASYQFTLSYDQDNVYVAVNVVDERVIVTRERPPWGQDGIEISLDVRDDPLRTGNRRPARGVWTDYAQLAFSPAQGSTAQLWEPEKVPIGVQVACVPNAHGYAAEVAFPRRVLENLGRHGPFEALRFNIAIHDADEEAGPSAVLWWQPDWRQPNNRPASGTFRVTR